MRRGKTFWLAWAMAVVLGVGTGAEGVMASSAESTAGDDGDTGSFPGRAAHSSGVEESATEELGTESETEQQGPRTITVVVQSLIGNKMTYTVRESAGSSGALGANAGTGGSAAGSGTETSGSTAAGSDEETGGSSGAGSNSGSSGMPDFSQMPSGFTPPGSQSSESGSGSEENGTATEELSEGETSDGSGAAGPGTEAGGSTAAGSNTETGGNSAAGSDTGSSGMPDFSQMPSGFTPPGSQSSESGSGSEENGTASEEQSEGETSGSGAGSGTEAGGNSAAGSDTGSSGMPDFSKMFSGNGSSDSNSSFPSGGFPGMSGTSSQETEVYIPVSVPVYTDTGKLTTYQILEEGDILEMTLETDETGQEVITQITLIGTTTS